MPRYPSLRRIGGQLSFPRDLRNVGGIMGFDALEFVGRFAVSDNQRTTTSTSFWTVSGAFLSPMPSHAQRVMYST